MRLNKLQTVGKLINLTIFLNKKKWIHHYIAYKTIENVLENLETQFI